jgi:hypothetical protein
MDYERAIQIASGRLRFGDPEHIEAVREIERQTRAEWAAAISDPGFGLEVHILENPVTGEKKTFCRVTD